ncbi:MAG: hypothetical protein A2Y38_03710 [Spirochaetes bacterium GWB1_59_5]|nr:MAG: hypothetical protein A2Y38_03710 [Spirochaetes bacterium GWB1_59_5]
MNVTAIAINSLALVLFAVSFFKDRAKTVQALRSALRSGAGLAPTLLGILVVIGLIMGFLTSATIGRILREGSGIPGVLTAALLGSVLHIPSPANVLIFLAAWACIKIPQELVELQFLGWRCTLARFGFTVVVVFLMALVFQRSLGKNPEGGSADV